nr:LysR family transcriptional regulator [Streptomyces coryli]
MRDIEIFLTLAEELHFGRTAERLRVSQARVSQSIAKQERRIGAALFERSSRKVEITEIGRELYGELKEAYERINGAVEAAAAAARGTTGILTLGVIGAQAHDFADVIGAFRSRHPAAELKFQEVHFSDPFGPLRRGEVDLSVTWLPVREPDLTVGPELISEQLLLLVGAGHPLAAKEQVMVEDLGDYVVTQSAHPQPPYWEEAVNPFRTPGGRPIRRGPKVATFQEVTACVAAGEAVTLVHRDAERYYQRPGIVYRHVPDAPIGTWALVWRTAGETPLLRAFAAVAREVRPQPQGRVSAS